ncbi:hypothetical protein [Flavobacterium sp. CS20]|jgi:putative transposase|uniref:hypothetical protein n=1 Tax=Flavobacterium sp. CS20 TaxID=2775246 RepID=UPI001B3A5285|nr:hypothetical protein [Flavobacterium sp. CS20]QTY26508.1 hypothetical protein IGB25_11360 [Flavobacterium sp. CS20]
MQFEKGHLYHIYNQGNNRRRIFFSRQNYYYFVKKLKIYVKPYADVLAWCLMPNHFHLMVYVKHLELLNSQQKSRSFNDSIGILLRSYTRAINKQENTSGSLFRQETKAICITCHKGLTPNSVNTIYGKSLNIKHPKSQYPQICFDYIHNNPYKAGLVITTTDWDYSSAKDYYENRNGSLINKELALEYVRVSSA